jgi:DNA processing protein
MSDEIKVLSLGDTVYPPLLTETSKPPATLYYRGNINLLTEPDLLAVVGSRKTTESGIQACNALLPSLATQDIILVSGLAYGIDSLAHRISVQAKQPTIAVLGSGIDDASIYPKENIGLAHEILQYGGLIISEYKPGTSPSAKQFPARNRIIAGICKATLVIQAAQRSGSLITARLALEGGREVFAVPGPITDASCEGTNMLIRDGAQPALSSADILSFFEQEEAKKEMLLARHA